MGHLRLTDYGIGEATDDDDASQPAKTFVRLETDDCEIVAVVLGKRPSSTSSCTKLIIDMSRNWL
ncbi:hypothetical protein RP20_CCG018353 [Aedes albopictus]|nr:hypothetical protein RP20_CCG018353 [Aedes albopictus]